MARMSGEIGNDDGRWHEVHDRTLMSILLVLATIARKFITQPSTQPFA